MRVRVKQSFLFHDRKQVLSSPSATPRTHHVSASAESQHVPDWIENDPAFDLMVESGHLEILTSAEPAKSSKPAETMGFQTKPDAATEAKAQAEAAETARQAKLTPEQRKAEQNAADDARILSPKDASQRIEGSPREVVEKVAADKAAAKAKADAEAAAKANG